MIEDKDILALDKVTTAMAARYLNMDDNTLRIGMQRNAFPFGRAFQGNNDKYIYDIRPEALVRYKHYGVQSPTVAELVDAVGVQLSNLLNINTRGELTQ